MGLASNLNLARLITLCYFALALTGCGTTLYSPQTGHPLAVMRSDITTGDYSGGGVTFSFAKMNNSVPTRAALLGTNKIIGTLGSAAIGLSVPGSGVAPLIGKTAISGMPLFTSPVAKPGD